MTEQQRRDRENDRADLRLLEKYVGAHRQRGTEPARDTLERYELLKRRLGAGGSAAA